MRNLKRALSLALASVMLVGMMVVGTSASYPDVSSKHNEEAIEVMQMLGIMEGDDKGNFNPSKAVTRNEMAVIMTKLLDLNTKDYAGATPFTDVPAWAEPYVAACYANKIVSGTSETTYSGDATVTTAQAALMMQKALGYFQFGSDFGDDWMVATVKQASKIDLFDGLTANANAALTRNDVAQMALNALEADVVDTDGNGGTVIKGDGFEITTGSAKYNKVEEKTDIYNGKNDGVQQLVEKLFDSKVKRTTGPDDMGHPAHKWTYKTEKVGPYADEADYTVVATKAYDSAVAAYKDLVDEDYKGNSVSEKYVNGNDSWDGKVQAGDVIEFYLNDNDVVTRAVNTRYSIGKVTKVDTKVSKADKDDDVTAYITVKDVAENNTLASKIKDTDFVGFDYAKGDVILFVLDGSKVLASQLAESVEGKVVAIKGSKVSVDGTYYDTVKKPALKDEGIFYLNAAGMIMESDTTAEKSGNYAYIYSVDIDDSGKNSDGLKTTVVTVYYVDQAGVKGSAVVKDPTIVTQANQPTKAYYDSAKTKEIKNGVVSYKINSDKEFELATAKNDIENSVQTAKVVDKDNAVIAAGINANSKTTFIFVDTKSDTSKVKVSTVDGYKNVKIPAGANVTAITDDDYALYAFVDTKNGNVASTGYIAVLLDTKPVETEDDDDTYYEFSVSVDGKDTTVTTKDENIKNALVNGGKGWVFSYNLEDGYVVDLNDEDATGISFNRYQTVSAVNDDYIVVNGKQYNIGDETVYTVTKDFKKDGSLDSVTVSAGGSYSKDNKITFTTDDGDLDVVFIIDEIR